MSDIEPMTPATFLDLMSVSRETLKKLEIYVEQLGKWQRAINLVGKNTLHDPWRRHILDSAQLWRLLPEPPRPIVDLGSGAGFPGLVLSILGAPDVTLCESDARKCVFLREVVRLTGASAVVREGRIETLTSPKVGIVTARALASLCTLLSFAAPILAQDGICLFLKGRGVDEELTQAGKGWNMRVEVFASLSDSAGKILRLGEISRAGPDGSRDTG